MNPTETRLQRLLFSILLVLALAHIQAVAQPEVAEPPAPEAWYDTLQVTQPRYANVSRMEQVALSAFGALSIPVGVSVGLVTLFPPAFTVHAEHGTAYGGISFSSGFGFGGEPEPYMYFNDARAQVGLAYYPDRERSTILSASVLRDFPLASIHSKDFFWLAGAAGLGIASDLHNYSPYAEAWLGVMNPQGLRSITLFPMHHYGIRARAGYTPGNGSQWYELAIIASSTFSW